MIHTMNVKRGMTMTEPMQVHDVAQAALGIWAGCRNWELKADGLELSEDELEAIRNFVEKDSEHFAEHVGLSVLHHVFGEEV